ncbi:MAG: hypothetical protein H6710_22035 [Myxococcales bacterium]|nr:hypothetical protein [Myxococcales bacterium]MCB9706459.1 hypothetical protein [Myxococcales bacterium]
MESAARDGGLWRAWTVATALGELAGFAIPAAVGALLGAAGVAEVPMAVGLVIAGAGEGAVLGAFQGRALARHLPGFPWRRWTAATSIAALIAWILGMTPSALLGGGEPPALPTWAWAFGGAVLGVAFLLVMGVAQWWVLRGGFRRAWRWIVASAIAWPLGVAVPVIALTSVPDGAPMVVHGIVGVVAGLGMGLVVGGITGRTLVRMLAEPVA